MKKINFLAIIMFVITLSAKSQNDTMYIMKQGLVWAQFKVNQIDSIIFYNPIIQASNKFIDARDGNVYNTVKIGSQVWMAENLAYLPKVNPASVGSDSIPYYYVYGYNGSSLSYAITTANYNTYGVLYNMPAAIDACPTGWHLPSDAEWTILSDTLGGNAIAGGVLKAIGLTYWNSPNTGATNEYGFTALASGYRIINGTFSGANNYAYWWSSTLDNQNNPWVRYTSYNNAVLGRDAVNGYKAYGFSVRCIKD